MEERPWGLAVKGILRNAQDRYLFIRRSTKSKFFGGKWDLPGGKVDPGESFADAMVRECAEETGLTVRLTGVAGADELSLPHVRVATLFLEAQIQSGEVLLSSEHEEARWVTREEALKLDLTEQLVEFLPAYFKAP